MKLCSWQIGFCLLAATITGHAAGMGISFDGSMGPAGTLTGPNYTIPASMGTQVGGNLFHSFGQFNLLNGETANFTATGSTGTISNIIARVTGGNASSIDGTITSSIAGANLFLLNPNGVMFGPHAQVNLTGAFSVGTPDYVKMADGMGMFHTSLGGNDVLTSAAVSEFGFLGNTPQPVQFSQSKLSFATGSNVTVIGGDITLDGATLTVPAGNISFFSANGSGSLPFNPANPGASFGASTVSSFGHVTLENGSKAAIGSAQGGGQVVIRGGVMVVKGASRITSANSSAVAGGSVEVDADTLTFLDSSNILTTTTGSGAAGSIAVTAQTLAIDGPSSTKIFSLKAGLASESLGSNAGPAGDITATVGGNLGISAGGEIASDTFSAGNAGNITIHTLSLSIDGSSTTGFFTGITSDTLGGATGHGGNVGIVATGDVSITGGGAITADTTSSQHAGAVNIQANTLTIDGSQAKGFFTGISSSDTGATGDGGSINLTINSGAQITATGEITTATFTVGNAGDIILHAGSLTINGTTGSKTLTGISSAAATASAGQGGNINLFVNRTLSLSDNGQISADTASTHAGGNISIQAGSLQTDGSQEGPNGFTGISASTEAGGQGGNLTVNVTKDIYFTGGSGLEEETFGSGPAGVLNVAVGGNITLIDAGFISGDTFGNGLGGTVTVTAPSIYIDASGPDGASAAVASLTGIASDSNAHFSAKGMGQGGSVLVTATDSLSITNGGLVAALTETAGNGGNVVVNVPGSISLSNNGEISAASSGTGAAGSVTINVGTLDLTNAGSVATSAVAADAGSIDITAANEISIMNGSSITTSAAANGGSIDLKVNSLVYLLDGSITATAGKLKQAGIAGSGGNIIIDPQFVVLDNGLISANAAAGQGGNIFIFTTNFLNTNSLITATGATDGTISISAPNLDLSGSLIGLPSVLVSSEDRLRENCARAINHEFSSLIVVGRGGTETAPEELHADIGESLHRD